MPNAPKLATNITAEAQMLAETFFCNNVAVRETAIVGNVVQSGMHMGGDATLSRATHLSIVPHFLSGQAVNKMGPLARLSLNPRTVPERQPRLRQITNIIDLFSANFTSDKGAI